MIYLKKPDNLINKIILVTFMLILLLFNISIAAYNIFSILLLLMLIVKKIKDKNLAITYTEYNKYLFIFFIFSFLSIFKGGNFQESFDILLSPIFSYIALFFISIEIINKNNIINFLKPIFLGGLIFIFFGLYNDFILKEDFFYRNNQLATTSGFLIIIFGAYILYGKNKYYKIASFLGVIASLIANILSYSRGAFLGLIISLIFFLSLILWDKLHSCFNKKIIITTIIGVIIVVLITTPLLLPDKLINRFQNTDFNKNTNGRLVLFRASINMIKNNPFLGVGIANFNDEYNSYLEKTFTNNQIKRLNLQFDKAHNVYLDIPAKQGIISLLIFLALLYKSFKLGLNNYNTADTKEKKYLSITFVSILLFSIVHSFVDTTIYFHHVALYLIIFFTFNYKLLEGDG